MNFKNPLFVRSTLLFYHKRMAPESLIVANRERSPLLLKTDIGADRLLEGGNSMNDDSNSIFNLQVRKMNESQLCVEYKKITKWR
jgi:hypothetical protein